MNKSPISTSKNILKKSKIAAAVGMAAAGSYQWIEGDLAHALDANPVLSQYSRHFDAEGTSEDFIGTASFQAVNKIAAGGAIVYGPFRGTPTRPFFLDQVNGNGGHTKTGFTSMPLDKGDSPTRQIRMTLPLISSDRFVQEREQYFYVKDGRSFLVSPHVTRYPSNAVEQPNFFSKNDLIYEIKSPEVNSMLTRAVAMGTPIMFWDEVINSNAQNKVIPIISQNGSVFDLYSWNYGSAESTPEKVATLSSWRKDQNGYLIGIDTSGRTWIGSRLLAYNGVPSGFDQSIHEVEVFHEKYSSDTAKIKFAAKRKGSSLYAGHFETDLVTGAVFTQSAIGAGDFNLISSHPSFVYRRGNSIYWDANVFEGTLSGDYANYTYLWKHWYQSALTGNLQTQMSAPGIGYATFYDKAANKVIYFNSSELPSNHAWQGSSAFTTFNGPADFYMVWKNIGWINNQTDQADSFFTFSDSNGVYHNTRGASGNLTNRVPYAASAANNVRVTGRSLLGFKYNNGDYKDYFQTRFSSQKKVLEETPNIRNKLIFINGDIFGIGRSSCASPIGTAESGESYESIYKWGTAYFANNMLYMDHWSEYSSTGSGTECSSYPDGANLKLVNIGSTVDLHLPDRSVAFGAAEGLTLADSMADHYTGKVVGLSTAGDLLLGGVMFTDGVTTSVLRELNPYPVFDVAPPIASVSRGTFQDRVELTWNPVVQANYYQIWRDGVMIKDRLSLTSFKDYDSKSGPSRKATYQVKAIKENNITQAGGFVLAQSSVEEGWINGSPSLVNGLLFGVSGQIIEGVLGNDDPDGVNDTYVYQVAQQPLLGDGSLVGRSYSHDLPPGIFGVFASKIRVTDASGKIAESFVPTIAQAGVEFAGVNVSAGTFEDRIEVSWPELQYNEIAKIPGGSIYYEVYRKEPGGNTYVLMSTLDKRSFVDTTALASNYSKGNAPSYLVKAFAKVRDASNTLVNREIYTSAGKTGWINRPPVISELAKVVAVGGNVNMSPTVSDPDQNEVLTYSVGRVAKFGSSIMSANQFRYTPEPETPSVDTFEMKVTDSSGVSATAKALVYATTTIKQAIFVDQGAAGDKIGIRWNPVNVGESVSEEIFYRLYVRGPDDSAFTLLADRLPNNTYVDSRETVKTYSFNKPASYYVEAIAKGSLPETKLWTTSTVTGYVNNIPTRVYGVFQTNEGSGFSFAPKVDDADVNDSHTFRIITPPEYGSASATGSLVQYSPQAGFFGVDSFEVEAQDGPGGKVRGFVTVVVKALNEQPLNASKGTYKDRIVLDWTALKAKFGNTNGSVFYKVLAQGPSDPVYQELVASHSAISFNDARGGLKDKTIGNQMNYKFEAYLNIDGLNYKVSSSRVEKGWVNNPPQASVGYSVVDSGINTSIPMEVSDPDFGDTFTFKISQPALNGTAKINASGQLEYQSNIGFWGADSFAVEAVDRSGGKVRGVVQILVRTSEKKPINVSRGLYADKIQLSWDAPTVVWGDEAGLVFYKVYGKQKADSGFSLLNSKNIATDYSDVRSVALSKSYTDPMEYQIEWYLQAPNQNAEKIATSVIKSGWINNAPTSLAGTYITTEGKNLTFTPVIVDKDLPNDEHTLEIVKQAENGIASITGKDIVYSPKPGFYGVDAFQVKATDYSGLSITGTIYTVVKANEAKANAITATQSDFKDLVRLQWENTPRVNGLSGYEINYVVEETDPGKSAIKLNANTLFDNNFSDRRSDLVDLKRGITNPVNYRVRAQVKTASMATPVDVAELGVVQGWINTPPVLESANVDVFQRDGAKEIPFKIIDLDPSETKDVQIIKQGVLGRAIYSRTDGKLFYQPSGDVGSDKFTISVTDRVGNVATKEIFVQVQCQNPMINTTTIKDGVQALLFQNDAIKLNTTIEICHASVKTRIDIFDSSNKLLDYTSHNRNSKIGVEKEDKFYLRDLLPGRYKAIVSVGGPTVINETVAEYSFDVVETVLPALKLNKTALTEDEIFEASVVQAGESCQVTNDSGDAIQNNKCVVDWTILPSGLVDPKDTKVSGYSRRGGNQQIEAVVSYYDSRQVKREIGRLTDYVSVLPGLPILMNHPFFGSDVRKISDYNFFELTRKSGYECNIYKDKTAADRAFLNDPFAKVCLFRWEKIPTGMYQVGSVSSLAGRVVVKGEEDVRYIVSKYYRDGSQIDMPVDGFTIPVFDTSVISGYQGSQASYVVNAQKASGVVVDKGTKDDFHPCRLITSVDEAKNSYVAEKATTIGCLVQFKTVPAGMYTSPRSIQPGIEGIPSTLGESPVEWDIKVVLPNNEILKIGEGSGKVLAKEATSALVEFVQNTTLQTVELSGTRIPVVDIGVKLGDVLVKNAEFGTVQLFVKEVGSPAIDSYPRMKEGSTAEVIPRAREKAWKVREYEARAEYEDLGSSKPAAEITRFKAIQAPPEIRVFIETELGAIPDNANFNAVVNIASIETGFYSVAEDGEWEVHLAERQGTSFAPISAKFPIDSKGRGVVLDQPPEAYDGRNVLAIVTSKNYPDSKFVYQSRPQSVALVRGGPIPAQIAVDKREGFTPLRINLKSELNDRADSAIVSEYVYEYSKDNGSTWEPVYRGRKPSTLFELGTGGDYLFRLRVINANSQAEFTSESVAVHATQAYTAKIEGLNLLLPGQTSSLKAVIINPTTGTVADPSEYDAEWILDDRRSPLKLINGTDQVSVTSEFEGTVTATLRVKSKLEPTTKDTAYTVVRETLNFGVGIKPRAVSSGDRFVEVGNEALLRAVVREGWGRTDKIRTELKVMSEWELPDGTVVPATGDVFYKPADFDVNQQDPRFNPTIQFQKAKLRAWVDGAKDKTLVQAEHQIAVSKYVFPTFIIRTRADSLVAPAFSMIEVAPATPRDQKFMLGKKLNYEWSVPNGVQGRTIGPRYDSSIQFEGAYPFSVKISDDRGNSQTLDLLVEVKEANPYELDVNILPGLRFNREPMTWIVRSRQSGGHPRDRIKNVELYIDNELVGVGRNGSPPRLFVIPKAGTYEIKLKAYSEFGKEVEQIKSITVNPNSPAECEPFTMTTSSNNDFNTLTSRCVDFDGRLKQLAWYVDGIEHRSKARRLVIDWNNDPVFKGLSVANVKFSIFDDSGAETIVEQVISRPSGAKPPVVVSP